MKILLALGLMQLPLLASASEYLEDFERLKKSDNAAEIQKFLDKAAETEKGNPDYYASAGNYWWQLSKSVSLSTKASEKDDFSLRDQKTGKEVGSISTVGRVSPGIPKKALAILSEGVRRFPQRADISFGLAHVQREMGLQSECVDTLVGLLSVAKSDLRWTNNNELPQPAKRFIPESVQSYSVALYKADTSATDALCEKLCDGTIAAFPDHPFAYNIKAALAAAHGKQDETLRYLEIASSKAPDDALILLNLGDAHLKAKQPSKAKQAYTKVLKIKELDDSLRGQARKAIENIQQSGGGKRE